MFDPKPFVRGINASNIPRYQFHCSREERLVLLVERLIFANFSTMVDWVPASISSLVFVPFDFLPLGLGDFFPAAINLFVESLKWIKY